MYFVLFSGGDCEDPNASVTRNQVFLTKSKVVRINIYFHTTVKDSMFLLQKSYQSRKLSFRRIPSQFLRSEINVEPRSWALEYVVVLRPRTAVEKVWAPMLVQSGVHLSHQPSSVD